MLTKTFYIFASILVALAAVGVYFAFAPSDPVDSNASIFDFDIPNSSGTSMNLGKSFKGKKAYLIVNVASNCGLTSSNYDELKMLHDSYSGKGLQILAFPCNNFGAQEPGSNEDIQGFAKYNEIKFPVLGKLECQNGDSTHPLYRFL